MSRVDEIDTELDAIAAELGEIVPREIALRERQRALWQEGRDLGRSSVHLARHSRVLPVTVRKYTEKKEKSDAQAVE